MSMTEKEVARKTRKPKARHRDVIIGCLEERLLIMNSDDAPHASRCIGLLDELKRSLAGKDQDDSE